MEDRVATSGSRQCQRTRWVEKVFCPAHTNDIQKVHDPRVIAVSVDGPLLRSLGMVLAIGASTSAGKESMGLAGSRTRTWLRQGTLMGVMDA